MVNLSHRVTLSLDVIRTRLISPPREHIIRCHAPPPNSCSRCCEPFGSPKELTEHQRAEIRCPVKELNVADGIITVDQLANLRTRKRTQNMTEVQKWYELYEALFSLDDPANLPFPCKPPEVVKTPHTSRIRIDAGLYSL